MIPVTLTTPNGESKTIPFYTKQHVEKFIAFFPEKLPVGYTVNVNAPLIGLSGWIRGTMPLK